MIFDKYSYCGYDCKNCKAYEATKNRDYDQVKKVVKSNDDIKKLICEGCKSNVVSSICKDCYIKKCNENKNIDSCSKCKEYPCEYLNKNISKETKENLNKMNNIINKKRCAVIGMCGNSLFYDVRNGKEELVHQEVGGKGYNQAVAILRSGVKVSFLSAIGNDKNGDLCEDYIRNEGADCFFVRKEKPTLEARILVDDKGNNTVIYDQENVAKLTREDVVHFEDQISKSSILLLQYEYDKEVIEEAIRLAKKHGVMVVVNPAPMIYDDINLIVDVDIITPNEIEARTLFEIDRNKSLKYLFEKEQNSQFKMVINTLGEAGLALVTKNNIEKYEPIKVKAVDTTGAGDTFNGVFVANIVKGLSINEAIKKGVIASGLSVTKKYVMGAIPFEIEINNYKK